MKKSTIKVNGKSIKVYIAGAAVVGTGAAGYAAAMYLYEHGTTDVVMITEGVLCGTSRNTGSDKQTYYKLSLAGSVEDSPASMAQDLFAGGAVDGDVALAEAANSVSCFMRLASLGVAFPTNRYGEYVGYKTDHDPRARATSVGPLTSKVMTEALEARVAALHIPVLNHWLVVEILKRDDHAVGLLAWNKVQGEYVLLSCPNIVWATGGPAGIYGDSVYPVCHTGSTGVLLESGIFAQNLTEWQFGLASIAPRWNVSGTYMQELPRFVSVDQLGTEHYFVEEYFPAEDGLVRTFLKGYEWPFDSRKAEGSSAIDLLVARERALGRRVYLDFTENPYGAVDYHALSPDALSYLEQAGACFGTPIERLIHMNQPAYELYLDKGVDLKRERLEISLCAQHCNGGAAVDAWWQSSLTGLFVIGEAAGTHGVYRPGGSALNAGQVGALRAANYIARYPRPFDENFRVVAKEAYQRHAKMLENVLSGDNSNVSRFSDTLRSTMSRIAGAVRDPEAITVEWSGTRNMLQDFSYLVHIRTVEEVPSLYKLKDNLACRLAVLTAMRDFYQKAEGKTRGSALYQNPDGKAPCGLTDMTFIGGAGLTDEVQMVKLDGTVRWRPVRPIPVGGGFFENVWKTYRENGGVY